MDSCGRTLFMNYQQLGPRPCPKAKAGRQKRASKSVELFRFADNGKTSIDVLWIFNFVKYGNGEISITYIAFTF